MLRIIYIIALSIVFLPWLSGQQSSDMKTLFSENARISAFGNIVVGVLPFNKSYAGYIGGDGALVINDFYFGAYGSRNVEFKTVHSENEYYADKKLGFSQGGISTGYSFRSKQILQFSVGGQVGWGHLSLRDNIENKILSRDRVNVLMPAVQIKLNLTSFIQLCAGTSYQFLFGVDFPEMDDKNFRGLCGSLSIRFGWF